MHSETLKDGTELDPLYYAWDFKSKKEGEREGERERQREGEREGERGEMTFGFSTKTVPPRPLFRPRNWPGWLVIE